MTENVPENHGKYWTKEDYAQLKSLFAEGLSVEEIAARLKRNNNGIISQLVRLNLIVYIGNHYHKIDPKPYYRWRK